MSDHDRADPTDRADYLRSLLCLYMRSHYFRMQYWSVIYCDMLIIIYVVFSMVLLACIKTKHKLCYISTLIINTLLYTVNTTS